jgi:hypothetical protein
MIYELSLEFSPQKNPFFQDRGSGLVWGKIELYVLDNSIVLKKVIDMVWDIRELITWILDNEWNLFNDEFPRQYAKDGNSIAEFRAKYYEIYRSGDEIDDAADIMLENFGVHHCISYGMSGAETIDAYIGKINDGYEISYCGEQGNWNFEINLLKFINKAKIIRSKYL